MTSTNRCGDEIIRVQDLAVAYATRTGDIDAVRGVSFEIRERETLGLVGESGCGKSTVAYSLVNSLGANGRIKSGSILFQDHELVGRSEEELRRLRGNDIAMVYQDPTQALNPGLRIGIQLTEVITAHRDVDTRQAQATCIAMLQHVHLADPETLMTRYPHQLSGGQQQRVIIAMALLNDPKLLIMDEPTTALDVTVEAAVLDLVDEVRHRFRSAILYITHDLGVVAQVSDRVGVMYAGSLVELAPVERVFLSPLHPYTVGLLGCIPVPGSSKARDDLRPIRGKVPSPQSMPAGCVFAPRCDFAAARCEEESPQMKKVGPDHWVSCHIPRHEAASGARRTTIVAGPDPNEVPAGEPEPVLRVTGLKTFYEQERRSVASLIGRATPQYVKAVDNVTFEILGGRTLGVVGESGCGKTTLAKTIVGLESPTDGRIELLGLDICQPVEQRDFQVLQHIQMVFQNPESTLNPSFSAGRQISRSLRRLTETETADLRAETIKLLEAVRLDESYYGRMPRQLSGGEKQRVAIARAIASHPMLMICDEPTSSLDVSVQAAILNLLLGLERDTKSTMLFISHDLSCVRFIADFLAVMYLGRICEIGSNQAVCAPPYHPYTEALLSAVPVPDPQAEQKRIRLVGTVPSALEPPAGCRFQTRCPRKIGSQCETESPPERHAGEMHSIYCHIPLDELRGVSPVIRQAPVAARADS